VSAATGIAGVHARIAGIEARLPGARAGRDVRSAASFEQALAVAAQATSGATPTPPAPAAATGARSMVGVPFSDLFEQAGARHGVDPALLAAVAQVESGYDSRAVSHAGARGLMQLMPATASGLGVTDPFDPAQAVDGAARLLAGHLERFGSTELALAAYNAGPGAVARHGGIPPYAETQAYVPKVLHRYEELRR